MANSKDNISKYATSYISFDEAFGNVNETINGYTGIPFNAPTRVLGWNGEGYAMSFNGTNQYVQFNSKLINDNATEFSIRLKLKTTFSHPTAIGTILDNRGAATIPHYGLLIYFDKGTFSAQPFSNGVNIGTFNTSKNIADGLWHDVLTTFDNGNLKIYVDDMITPDIDATVAVQSLSFKNNMSIGRISDLNNYFFNGQIDQIEIYDRVISHIPDKHLILHGNSYKYHDGTSWQSTTNTTENFIQYGHNDLSHITESQWLELTGDKSVVVWSDFEDKQTASIVLERETFTPLDVIGNEYDIVIYDTDTKTQQLELTASPDDQELISLQDIPLIGVETINKVTVNGTGSGKVGFSIDGGVTYRAFKSGQWIPIANMNDGNTFDEVNNLTTAQISLLRGDSNIIRMSFFITHDAVVEDVKMICSFEGSERLAPSNLYDVSYDMATKTITYKIKQAGLYAFSYTDIE